MEKKMKNVLNTYPHVSSHTHVTFLYPRRNSLPAGSFAVVIPIIIRLLLPQQPFQNRSNAVPRDRAALPYAWVFLTGISVQARWEQRKKPSCTCCCLCFDNEQQSSSTD